MNARGTLVVLLLLIVPAAAHAQIYVGSRAPRRGTVEVSGGGFWSGGQDVPRQSASLTPNPSGGAGSFDLFAGDPSLEQAFGASGTVAVYLTRRLAFEGGLQISRPRVTARLSDDFEDAPNETARTTFTEYLITGSAVYHFGTPGRMTPFVGGGAGHVRDVFAGNELIESGTEYHGSGGVKMWFGRRRNIAFRAEGGVSVRDGGFTLDEDRRTVPFAGGSIAYMF